MQHSVPPFADGVASRHAACGPLLWLAFARVLGLGLLHLHFNGEVDATGIATVLLAIATAILAGFTRASVHQAGKELEQSQRPVLVPFAGQDLSVPSLMPQGSFLLPVKNVGVGPAMDVTGEIEFGDVGGNPTAAGAISGRAAMTAIGAGENVSLEFRSIALQAEMGFAFNIQYHDVSGKVWHSRGGYSQAEGVFRDVEVLDAAMSEATKYRIHSRVHHRLVASE